MWASCYDDDTKKEETRFLSNRPFLRLLDIQKKSPNFFCEGSGIYRFFF